RVYILRTRRKGHHEVAAGSIEAQKERFKLRPALIQPAAQQQRRLQRDGLAQQIGLTIVGDSGSLFQASAPFRTLTGAVVSTRSRRRKASRTFVLASRPVPARNCMP